MEGGRRMMEDMSSIYQLSDKLRLQTSFSNLSFGSSIWSDRAVAGGVGADPALPVAASWKTVAPFLSSSSKLAFGSHTNVARFNNNSREVSREVRDGEVKNYFSKGGNDGGNGAGKNFKSGDFLGSGGNVGKKKNVAVANNHHHNRKNSNSSDNNSKNNSKDGSNNGTAAAAADKRFKTLPAAEALPRDEAIGGYIFVCNNETMEENLRRQLFGLPSRYRDSVRAIRPGLPLFLYNYSTHQLHGIFEAASFGGANIDPTAWEDKKCPGESRFPAQVRVVTRKLCGPLEEDSFRPILHHYDGPKFRLELSVPEALELLDIFSEESS